MRCCLYDINKNFIQYAFTNGQGLAVPNDCYFIRGYSVKTDTSNLNIVIQREVPIALNELPNGVKDELIINRATSSAKLIQRVGKGVLDGSEVWRCNPTAKYFAISGVGHKSRSMGAGAFSDKLNY